RTPAVARPPPPDTRTASTTTEAARRRPRAMLPRYVCNVGVTILTWGIVSRSVEIGEYRVLRSGDGERPRTGANWRFDEAPEPTLSRRPGDRRSSRTRRCAGAGRRSAGRPAGCTRPRAAGSHAVGGGGAARRRPRGRRAAGRPHRRRGGRAARVSAGGPGHPGPPGWGT